MKNNLFILLWVLFATVLNAEAAEVARPLELVRDGKAVATIVIASPREAEAPANAKGRAAKRKQAAETDETLAVKTLVEWVKKITDVELPVAGEVAEGAAAVYVGQAAIDAGLKLDDIESESREGIRIVADGRRVLIAGQSEAATLKAVCRFLEELGCRYTFQQSTIFLR